MITVKLLKREKITVSLKDFTVSGGSRIEYYDGAYEVTPQREKQVLPTAKKFLTDDVTVGETPYHEIENAHGGTTAIIGG